MPRHRVLAVAIAAGVALACTPSLDSHTQNPASTNYVVFDPTSSQIPQPNDLALQTAATQTGAQGELLQSFAAQGGFPNDQDLPITIDVQQFTYGGGAQASAPPQRGVPTAGVDPATLVVNAPSSTGQRPTIALFELKPGAAAPTAVDPKSVAVSYVTSSDRGSIVIQNKPHAVTLPSGQIIQSTRWNAGSRYVVEVAGGANGVKLTDGTPPTQMATMAVLTAGQDLTLPQNQGVLPGNGAAEKRASGEQLEAIRQSYLQAGVLGSAQKPGLPEAVFGPGATQNLLAVQTFQVAPAKSGAAVITDASAGIVPLPSDLLLDPATNKIVNNPAFGPLAGGIATLDGFSTTAMELTQTSAPVVAGTVNANTVFLYDLSNPSQPVRLKELQETVQAAGTGAGFVAEPYTMTKNGTGAACGPTESPCFSTAIGLQPAVPVPLSAAPTGPFATLPPLKEGTEYAVLVTDGVKDTTGAALQGSTLARILLFQSPLVDANGKSQLPGQTDATAGGLEKIRQGVAAAAAALAAEKPALTKDHIVLGYTFRTQTITQPALQLAAAPYQQAAALLGKVGTPVDLTKAGAVPALPNVQAVLSVAIASPNTIDVATGATNPDTSKWTTALLDAWVAVPTGPKSGAPLVVFAHGLGRDKSDMLALASAFAQAGFVVAAVDIPLHGERAYCVADTECLCVGGGTTCNAKCDLFPAGAQGDAKSGVCSAGSVPTGPTATPGQPISGRFFFSANLFRIRDTFRQNAIDVSALTLALAPPTGAATPFSTALAALGTPAGSAGVTIDPSKVYFIGQSLGGIAGTVATAVNPRITRAVLNAAGATFADDIAESIRFAPLVDAVLQQVPPPLGPITRGSPQFLQFIQIAKLVLDGGDPLNFAGHLTGDAAHPTLPDLLANKPNQAAKSILGQVALGDQAVPNPTNYELFGNVFSSPMPDLTLTRSNVCTYSVAGGDPASAHGFLLDPTWSAAQTAAAQGDAAAFLADPTHLPPAARPL